MSAAPGPGLLLLASGANADQVRDVLSAGATRVQAARRSDFHSAKRDEHGNEIALVPLDADLLLEARYESDDARDRAAKAVAAQLRESGLTSRLVLGDVHDLIDGEGAVTVAFFAAGRPDLTRAQFQHYWLNNHALLAGKVPNGPSYRQLHVLDPSSTDASGLDLDSWCGVTTMQYPSYDVLGRTRLSPEVAVTAFLDEQTFIDHSRSSMAFFDAIDL